MRVTKFVLHDEKPLGEYRGQTINVIDQLNRQRAEKIQKKNIISEILKIIIFMAKENIITI